MNPKFFPDFDLVAVYPEAIRYPINLPFLLVQNNRDLIFTF